MRWDDYIGHTVQAYDGAPYVIVERDRTGFWVQCLGDLDWSKTQALRSISESAINRTFHHVHRKCAKCRMEEYASKRENEGKSAADVYRERYPQKASG